MIKEAVTAFALCGSALGGYIFIDDRYAEKQIVASSMQEQRLEWIDYRIGEKSREIGKLEARVQMGTATPEEHQRLEELKSDRDYLREHKQSIQK